MKFNDVLHRQFIAGNVNGAIFEYMQKLAPYVMDNKIDTYVELMEHMTNVNIKSVQDCDEYFCIKQNAAAEFEALTNSKIANQYINKLCKYAYLHKNNYNFNVLHNYSKLVLDFINENKMLIKNAHPNNVGIESDNVASVPYDVDKWIEVMRYIYNTANTNNLTLDSVTNTVIRKWDEQEKINFKRWMKYYGEGNYSKYNVKTAQFFQLSRQQNADKTMEHKPAKDMFDTSAFPTPDPIEEKKKKLYEARKKIRGRLKSIFELLDQYCDVLPREDSEVMRKSIYDLTERVWNLELKASFVDSIMRTSNCFYKYGFVEGAVQLKKIAQEVAENKLPEVPAEKSLIKQEPAQKMVEAPATVHDDKSDIHVPTLSIGHEPIEIPDFSAATHRDALQKLEEINKVISERNVVRALAAVDIILGQLGIASYFPQLSEAQSKMMDAFNYAGTRVAETIGQMRGGLSGSDVNKPKPHEDSVDVSEDLQKPVGEVISGPPKTIISETK